jgi:exopolyphosphatase / guanosine-5'-triphosphate,3'-diphosphate pyrophosphatase
MPTSARLRMGSGMRVGIVDVGSNTVRLLVAERAEHGVASLHEERAPAGIAREIERTGRITKSKIREAASLARGLTRAAVDSGATRVEVLVTAPGRQAANGDELVDALLSSTRAPVHALTAEQEGRLAFAGALAALPCPPASVAVCDVGGGSTQLVFGTAVDGPVWFRSLDIGSLRLTQRFFAHDPPREDELAAARAEVESCFSGVAPPLPRAALAAGGTARALRRLVGRTLGGKELARVTSRAGVRPAAQLARAYGLEAWRAETLAGGAIILTEAQRRLGVPLVVARGGLREGAALELLQRVAAEAA